MKVLEYLKDHSLAELKEEFGIKVSQNELYPELYVLNYNQIESPKTHEIVRECRSLVIGSSDGVNFSVVSRSFSRFFNYGECDYKPDLSTLTCHEKIDGSLIGVFYYNGEWLYRTKSVIMPTASVNGFDTSWKAFIEEGLTWNYLVEYLNRREGKNNTFIFEVVGRENRIVVQYKGTDAYFLSARNNDTGDYRDIAFDNYKTPKKYRFSSTEDCMAMVRELPNLEEGMVAYNSMGCPMCKIKSPAYLAAHKLRGNDGLTPNRIAEMVVSNEYDEYLSIFGEDKEFFEPYIEVWQGIIERINLADFLTNNIDNKKDFAMRVKDLPFSAVLFSFRNNSDTNVINTLNSSKTSYKVKLLLSQMEYDK